MKETLFRRAGSLLVGLCLLAGAALATVMMDRQTIMTASKPDNKRFFI